MEVRFLTGNSVIDVFEEVHAGVNQFQVVQCIFNDSYVINLPAVSIA